MKIIFVLNHFLPDQLGGTEIYVYNLMQQLTLKGFDVIAIIPNYGKNITEEYFVGQQRVIKFAEPSEVDRSLIMGKKDPKGLIYFGEIIKKENPDIVHFHELEAGSGITLRHIKISKQMGFKNIMTFHLSGYSCKTGNLMYKDKMYCDGKIKIDKCSACYYNSKNAGFFVTSVLYTFSSILHKVGIDSSKLNNKIGTAVSFLFLIEKLKVNLEKIAFNCEALISLTEWYKEILIKNGLPADKISFISQGLTTQAVLQNEIRILPNHLKIIFVGRISPLKGIHLLIKAISELDENKVMLDIYGHDPDDDYSRQLKTKSSKLSNINWKGVLVPEQVVATMSNYSLLCLPSTFSEMSPLVIQEAFAAGIPVIASNVYGNAEQILDGKNGWLFTFNDSHHLRFKLQQLITDPSLIENAKKHIQPVKSFVNVAEEHIHLYKRILAAK